MIGNYPRILVRTRDTTYYCNAIMTGVPSSHEFYVISQNHTLILKMEDVQEIMLIDWRNPISEIIPIDIENDRSNVIVLQRVAPSETSR